MIHAQVVEASGGYVTLMVRRDTMDYPEPGQRVVIAADARLITHAPADLDRITELEAALAAAEGARLAAERGLAGEGGCRHRVGGPMCDCEPEPVRRVAETAEGTAE